MHQITCDTVESAKISACGSCGSCWRLFRGREQNVKTFVVYAVSGSKAGVNLHRESEAFLDL